jgi:Tfp pilus assembly protein PilF
VIAFDLQHIWILIMRFSPAAIALSLTLAMISSAGIGKKADHEIDPASLMMMQKGDAALTAKKNDEAVNWYETALAVDPRNRAAYIGMARAVKAQGLNGKAIRFYKEALALEPNDTVALTEQAEAMIAKGALGPAKANLARLRFLCSGDCRNVDQLAIAINKTPEKPVLQASAVEIKPVVSESKEKAN